MTEVTEVYINDGEEPYVLEEDGKLDLRGFKLEYPSISLQGKKGLVDNDTGMTKRNWAKLLEVLPAGGEGELGSKANPLLVKGEVASLESTAPGIAHSSLQGFMKQTIIEEVKKAVSKGASSESEAISAASSADAQSALGYLGFTDVDGHDIEPLPTPPPDFPECKPFPFWEYSSEDSASADLTAYHKKQLEIMGITMGRGGFDVKDLHNKKDLFAVCVENKWYRGGLDSAVLPYAVRASTAANRIRVAFEHKQSQEDKKIYAESHGRQGGASEGFQRKLLSRYYGQAVMALIAAVAVNTVPLDLVLTDGHRYVILRFRDDLLLTYEDLTATQAYFAIAEGLKQYATLKAAPGKAPEELMNDINPRMIEAHCTLKRKLKECGVGEALEDQLASIVSSGAPLEQRLRDSYDILFPWVPQLESRMPPEVQAFYA